MILYRPPRDRRTVRVQYVDDRRAGVVVRIRLFEAASFCATRLAEAKTNLQGCLSAEAFWTSADTHTSKRASEVIAR
jgi:hypothetical protein